MEYDPLSTRRKPPVDMEDMETRLSCLPYFNRKTKITLPFTHTDVNDFLAFIKSIDCDEQTVQNKKVLLIVLREKIRDYCLNFFVDIQDVSWDDFSWQHLRHLQNDFDAYIAITGFDVEQQKMTYLYNFKVDLEVSLESFAMIDQIQQAYQSQGEDIVDFDMRGSGAVHVHRVKQEGNQFERDVFSRGIYETISTDTSLSSFEKFRHMYIYTMSWMRKKQQQGEMFSDKVYRHVCKIVNLSSAQWQALSARQQVAIISLVFSSLVFTTKTPRVPTPPADFFDMHITQIPKETQQEIAQVLQKNLQATHGNQTEAVKGQVQEALHIPPPPTKDLQETPPPTQNPSPKEKPLSQVALQDDNRTTPPLDPRHFAVVPTPPKEQVHFTATTPLLEVDFDGVHLLKDPKSEVYYIRFKKGQSLLAINNTLKKYPQFAHLDKKNYRLLWNIDPTKISDGQIIPVPLDHHETLLTPQELKKIAGEAIDLMKKDKTYGPFIKDLEKAHTKKNLVRLMYLIVIKESDLGATAMYRNEPHIKKNSGSIFHVLYSGPGKKALDKLGFTWGEVMSDPQKATMWFLAFLYEKSHETGSPKPLSFFGLDNLKEFGTRYNGSSVYGKDLDAKNRYIK